MNQIDRSKAFRRRRIVQQAKRPALSWWGALFIALLVLCYCAVPARSDWPAFRGGAAVGVSEACELPATFDPPRSINVRWKKPLPGRGPSSPIVVGDRVFITAASGPRQDILHVICFISGDGRELWHRRFWATGHTVVDPFGGVAAPTPAADGEHVVAFFSSNDLICLDHHGRLKWFRGLAYESPATRNDVGMASSPLIVGDRVIVQCENQGASFAAGIDLTTGEDRWRIDRDRSAIWSSPTLFASGDGSAPVALLVGRAGLTAVSPRDGEILWTYEAPSHTIASPAVGPNGVFLPAVGVHAISPSSDGPTDSALLPRTAKRLWYQEQLRSDNASPVYHAGRLYVLKPPGILICADAVSGAQQWSVRLKGPFWASPVIADGRLWCVNHAGLVQIVSLNDPRTDVESIDLGEDGVLATPAPAGRAIFLRTDRHLWCIAKTESN